MRNKEFFKDKVVLIIGLARSGLSCARLLCGLGAKVRVTDNQDSPLTRKNLENLIQLGVEAELGRHSKEFLKGADLVIISPGVPNTSLPILWAKEAGIKVISEIEASWMLCPATIIAITGTNGKTTVTTLVGRILKDFGKNVFVCGNIGTPFSSLVESIKEDDFVVLEVSSFQLENIEKFRPKVAAVLNLSSNHLDRYKDIKEYLDAKKRIYLNQGSGDFLVLNEDDCRIRDIGADCRAERIYFRSSPDLNANYAAATAIASAFGIERSRALKALEGFQGVEHRMEKVLEFKGILFVNDSKSTTTEATVWALKNISAPVILIAGGREKGNDYSVVRELARNRVKRAFLIGESRENISLAFAGKVKTDFSSTLKEAVERAFNAASPGDCVLFSPMCKSFDMFMNFEERGISFKSAVMELAKLKK